MIMLCWFYCIPFAKLLYFSFGPLMVVFGLFALKRGIRNKRSGLRKAAFMMIFFSFIKICLFDLRMLKDVLLCGNERYLPFLSCSAKGFMALQVLGVAVLAAVSYALYQYYNFYHEEKKLPDIKPEDVNLRFWANFTLISVFMMAIWQMAPWVGSLVIGRTPHLFVAVPWQWLAMMNLALLLLSFWKLESCVWDYKVADKKKMDHLNKTWTPKDTIWMTVFLYLLTLALSYVAHDVLTSQYRN